MQYFFDFDPVEVEQEIQLRQEETKSTITMRPYQDEAVTAAFREWKNGARATLVCAPTGTGKSVIFSETMRRWKEQAA